MKKQTKDSPASDHTSSEALPSKSFSHMNAYPASAPQNSQDRINTSLKNGKAIAFSEAVRALNKARAQQAAPTASLPTEDAAAAAANFRLDVGVKADEADALHIRARVTSLDSGFTVMTFPAQHGSFLWELSLPAGHYHLEVKGTNADGGQTTASLQGSVFCAASQGSSADKEYVMCMNFAVL